MAAKTLLNPPAKLTASVPETNSAVGKIDSAVQKLEGIPDTSSSVVPNLAGHIQTAKQHGQQWQSKFRPGIVAALEGVAAYGAEFDKQYQPLLAAAKKLDGGGKEAIQEFKALLTKLQASGKTESSKASSVQGSIDGFDTLVSNDVRAFNGDKQQAQAAQQAASQREQAAQQRLRHLEREQEEQQEKLNSLGPFSGLARAIEALLRALGVKIGVTQQQFQAAERSAQQASQAFGVAEQAVGATGEYQSTVGAISGAVNSMMDGWEAMDGNFKTLLQSEEISSFNVFTQDVLAAAKADWDSLAQQAKKLG